MENVQKISVRALAEFVCRTGSLSSGEGMRERAQIGREGHSAVQEKMVLRWQTEVPAIRDIQFGDLVLRIQGRADAIRMDGSCLCVAEIKTVRCDPQDIDMLDYPEHWVQAEIYAWMLSARSTCAQAQTSLIYVGTNGGRQEFFMNHDIDSLCRRVEMYAEEYARSIGMLISWKNEAEPTMQGLPFPFDTYRDGQREMSEHVYHAMKDGCRVLIEAPTGIGKTAAALYGALKALGEGCITAVFYLTARTTGRRAAENAVELMRRKGLKARTVTLTAKEKICFKGKPDCGICPYGDGYYGRRKECLQEATGIERLNEQQIRALAEHYELCPFELSLDLTQTADIIICDYNYVFDPRIYLKRRFDKKSRVGLLIDEAHNLPDRAREMYSATLNGETVEKIRNKNLQLFGPEDELTRALGDMLNELTKEDAEYDALREIPEGLLERASVFSALAEKYRINDEETLDLAREAAWFLRIAKSFDEECYRLLIRPCGSRIEAKLWCFAPAKYLDRTFERVGGAALFSATIAPIDFYARQLAVHDRAECLVLESPFPPENLFAARLPISVKFRDRKETLEQVSRVIRAMTQTHTGNYMVCFPSHAYLSQVWQYYRTRFPDEHMIRQETTMSEKKRTEFIAQFQAHPQRSMLAFIVLGGVFSEGVDLPDDLLSGVAVVSTGIPQVNPESEMLRELYDDGAEEGYDTAYTYPGFRRVLQAAGRVIRTETDRGVVLLLDARYSAEKYQDLFPNHWKMRKIASMSKLNAALERFWGDCS